MSKKKYPNLENESSQAKVDEPMAAYGVNARLTPYTMEELNARIDEAENDIVAGRTYTNEQVHDMMEKKYPCLKQVSPAQYTLDELKAHLATSLEDIQAGRVYNHDDIPNLRPQWKLR